MGISTLNKNTNNAKNKHCYAAEHHDAPFSPLGDRSAGSEAKIAEEIEELKTAESDQDKFEEAGDFLFAAVNFVRAHGISAEDALRAANSKFERRFKGMEELSGGKFPSLTLDQQEALWQAVKKAE